MQYQSSQRQCTWYQRCFSVKPISREILCLHLSQRQAEEPWHICQYWSSKSSIRCRRSSMAWQVCPYLTPGKDPCACGRRDQQAKRGVANVRCCGSTTPKMAFFSGVSECNCFAAAAMAASLLFIRAAYGK